MVDDLSLVFCVSADVSVRERMVRRLDGLGTLVICTDLAELQAMIGPPMVNGPARLNPAAPGAVGASAARPKPPAPAPAPKAAASRGLPPRPPLL